MVMVKKRQGGPPDLYQMMRTQTRFPFRRQQNAKPRQTGMDVLTSSNGFEDPWSMYSWGAGQSRRSSVSMPIPKEVRPKAVRKLEALVRNGVAFTSEEETLLANLLGLFGQSAMSSSEIAALGGKFSRNSLESLEWKISRLLNRLKADAPWAMQHVPTNWKSSESLPPRTPGVSGLAIILQLFN